MKVIKRLFSNSQYIPAQQLASQYLDSIRMNSNDELPAQYQNLLSMAMIKCQKPNEFLKELLKALKALDSHATILKMLTLIHHFVIDRQYAREDIQELEEFDMHLFNQKGQKNEQKWFGQFCRSYSTYLMKLPSLSDVYANINSKQFNVVPGSHLTHIFRITNSVGVLFPSVTNAVNVVGRYQAAKHIAMRQLFSVLSGQLVKLYSYVKYLCDQIMRQYRVYNPKDLKCFIQSLPQLQLLCDKIQDLLVNKYLKGKKIVSKIEFKQQRVAELQYYLQYQYNQDPQKAKEKLPNE